MDNLQRITLTVTGMTCAGCEHKIESKLKKTTGIITVRSDYVKGTVRIKTTATPLQSKGATDVSMTITTSKIEWNRTDMLGNGTSSDYSVSAVLAPGNWTGTVTFECSMQ